MLRRSPVLRRRLYLLPAIAAVGHSYPAPLEGEGIMRGTQRGIRRFALLVALATAGVLVVGAQAASAQVIEICKSSANGMSGRGFSYTVAPSGGSAFSVGPIAGGRCSGPISVAGATAVITEAVSDPATDVKSVTVRPSNRKLSENLAGRSVTVTTGASTSSETLVTFVNQPAGGNYGSLKVCKLTETPAYLGRQFSFSSTAGRCSRRRQTTPSPTRPPTPAASWAPSRSARSSTCTSRSRPAPKCSGSTPTRVTNLLDFNTATGDPTVLISAGVTVVYYDNEPTPPSGTGWLEVCKNDLDGWWDPDAAGTYSFTVTDAAGATYQLSVLAGQCSEPIQVAAGVNEIVEAPKAGTDLTDVAAFPWDRLLTVNLINRTVTVEVPVSDSANDETQVHFRNEAQRGQLKVCKALGPGQRRPGRPDVLLQPTTRRQRPRTGSTSSITAAATTQCKIDGILPIGTIVKVDETSRRDNPNRCRRAGEFIDTTGEGDITIAAGHQHRHDHEHRQGPPRGLQGAIRSDVRRTLRSPWQPTQPTFKFKIDGGAIFTVQAGKCSPPKRVSVGNHTVTEVDEDNYELDPDAPGGGITAFPADREVSKSLATKTITVSVPYGANGETLVTFYNRVKRGRSRSASRSRYTSQDSLGKKTRSTSSPRTDGTATLTRRSDQAGRVHVLRPVRVPILNPDGEPTRRHRRPRERRDRRAHVSYRP